jgi:membrane protease YdiL (CAAX protease family)
MCGRIRKEVRACSRTSQVKRNGAGKGRHTGGTNMNRTGTFIARHTLASFFVLAFALEGIAVLLLAGDPTTLPFALVLVPALAAVTIAGISEGWPGVKALLGMFLRWRVAPWLYVAVLTLPLFGTLAIVASAVLLGAPTGELFSKLGPSTLLVLAVTLLPALAEELGWRGYALPRLLAGKRPPVAPLTAGLGLGVTWAALHLPLYLPGQMYDGLPLWPLPVIIVSYSVLLTWVFLNTGGSVLMAGLFHAALNGATPVTAGVDPAQAWQLRAVVFAVMALVVAAVAGPSLTRRKRSEAALEGQGQDITEEYIAEPVARG